jgi:hypothetical protein
MQSQENDTKEVKTKMPKLKRSQKETEVAIGSLLKKPISRRVMLLGSGAAATGAAVASSLSTLVGSTKSLSGQQVAEADTVSVNVTYAAGSAISNANRLALRALWDAIVPGNWNGNQEDGGQPGADQTYVEAWLEQVATAPGSPISWLSADFLNFWGADINAWAQVTTWFTQEYYQLPLGISIIWPSTRQGKVRLMMNLLVPGVETIFDLQYLGGIMLARLAFFGDFYFEANYPTISVGRAYCGAHLPPGTTPYAVDSFNVDLGLSNPNLIVVNGLVNAP